MPMWLQVLLGLYGLVVIINSLIELINMCVEPDNYTLATPISLHDCTDMNWPGCVLTWLIFALISPIMFIPKLCYFLFHL